MKKLSWTLLLSILLLIINNVEKSVSLCEKVDTKVLCTSVSEVSNITIGAIENIARVTHIEVNNNSQLVLSSSALLSTVSLEHVRVQYNRIDKIFPSTFKDLPLKQVYLNYNGINYIFPGAFVNLPQLERVSLIGNNLKTVPKGIFNNLTLQELTLSRNSISSIENEALEHMPSLKKLKLDGNKLSSIFLQTILTYPERLEILWLHNNSLTAVTNYMLQKLTSLRLINLGFNSIFIVEPNSFEQTPKLETLVLTHNQLKQIDGSVFPRKGLNYLEKLYLDNNRLMFLSSSFLFRLNNLKAITLVGNPWICPCLYDMQRLLIENNIVEKCAEKYTSGERPVCVSEKDTNNICRYIYNDDLREKYESYNERNPLYTRAIDCIL